EIVHGFRDISEYNDLDQSNAATPLEHYSLGNNPRLLEDTEMDRDDLRALTGIMRQYKEAYHLAERNELRGGILVPSNAYLDEDVQIEEEDDGATFDVFFDANDHSFYNAASVMAKSMMQSSGEDSTSSNGLDHVSTKLRFHLMSGCLKIVFRSPGEDLSPSNSNEYLLVMIEDISIVMSSTHRTSEILLNVSNFEVEDAQLRPLDPSSSGDHGSSFIRDGALEIGKLLGFVSEPSNPDDDVGDLLLSKPPCVTIQWKKTKDSDTVNVALLPLEFSFRHRTLSNLSDLKLVLDSKDTEKCRSEQSTNRELLSKEKKQREMSFSCSCPSITFSLPLLRRVATSELFQRSWEVVPDAEVTESSICVLFENISFELMTKRALRPEPGESSLAGDVSFHHFLVFVLAPESDSIAFGVRMQRKDIVVMSACTEVNPIIPISVAFAEVVPNGKDSNPGRETFPIVPGIASFKARQEDDDDDDENDSHDGVSVPAQNAAGAESSNQLRAVDPQISMLADAEKSSSVVTIRIPDIVSELTNAEIRVFLAMLDAVKPPAKKVKEREDSLHHSQNHQTQSSKMTSLSILCESATFVIHEGMPKKDTMSLFSCIFAADQTKLHLLMNGSNMQHCRVLCHDPALYSSISPYEAAPRARTATDVSDRSKVAKENVRSRLNGNTAPLLFRSRMFTPISNETPSILIDFINDAADPEDSSLKQTSLHLTLYHLTSRYDVDSMWMSRLSDLLQGNKSDIGPQEGPIEESQTGNPQQTPSMTRLFVSCADINFDYTSPTYFESVSRSIVRLGDLRLSSNIMNPAGPTQAYRLSIGDVNYHISNTRHSHTNEDSNLCRSSWFLVGESDQSGRTESPVFGFMPEAILREMGFVNALSLDRVDVILSQRKLGITSKKEAPLSIVLTLGNLSIQACKDSFNCFSNTVAELQSKLTALTDEDIYILRKNCSLSPVEQTDMSESSSETTEPNVWKDDQYLIPEIEVTPTRNENENYFLLDGYDWTTVDHDPLKELDISPGEEQRAGWYTTGQSATGTLPINIVHQHFPIQVIADPLSDGDLGATRFAGKGAEIHLKSRLLIKKMNARIRFFDGYDWPDSCSDSQREAAVRSGKMFVIEPEHPAVLRERKKLSQELESEGRIELSKKAQLVGALLDLDETEPSAFADTPLPEDRAKTLEREKHRQMNCRKSSVFFQVSLNEVTLRMDSFERSESHRLQSIMEVAVANFFVAETVSLSKPIKMFGEWANDEEHPRDTRFGNVMLSMATWAPRSKVTENFELASDECEVTVQLLPMRLLLDQRAITFIRAFVSSEIDEESAESTERKWSDGLHLVPPPKFRTFKIKPWKVKVDYRPARMDVAALREGSIVELVNISPIHRMVITLSEVAAVNSLGMGPVFSEIVSSWVKEICGTQLHKFLANARPFEPFTDVGQGLTDLVILPYEAFQAGESVQRAMRKGVKSLADIIVFQALTTTSGLTKYAADLMADILGGGRANNDEANPLPSRPLAVPKGVGDVRRHACESLARGIQTANYKIVVVPYREFSRHGVTGAITSVIKGIPVLLVAPLTGVTEAASYTLLGARNALRPDIRREEEASMSLH
ncbi:MAG: hypothetical protein SGILL_005523, partial [Bacillariaceae sp.]